MFLIMDPKHCITAADEKNLAIYRITVSTEFLSIVHLAAKADDIVMKKKDEDIG